MSLLGILPAFLIDDILQGSQMLCRMGCTLQRRTGGVFLLLIDKYRIAANLFDFSKIDSAVLGVHIIFAANLLEMDNGAAAFVFAHIFYGIQTGILYPENVGLLDHILGVHVFILKSNKTI